MEKCHYQKMYVEIPKKVLKKVITVKQAQQEAVDTLTTQNSLNEPQNENDLIGNIVVIGINHNKDKFIRQLQHIIRV